MERSHIEALLLEAAGAVLVDPRLVRRVIKQHRAATGLVPHGRCYPIAKSELLALSDSDELGVARHELPDEVILIARPSPRQIERRSEAEVLTRLWREVFHARVHRALDALAREGALTDSELRRRIDLIGQTEFDEIRAILRHDDVVLPPYGDREVYIEFAALYLELRAFAPQLLVTTFPGLGPYDNVDRALALDLEDPRPLLEEGRPDKVAGPAGVTQLGSTSSPSFSAPAAFAFTEQREMRPVSSSAHVRLLARAAVLREQGNDVRAALLALRAATVGDRDKHREADRAAREALASLGKRLSRALRGRGRDSERARHSEWSALLYLVADRAAAQWLLGYGPEARLLFGLQKAAVAFERGDSTVDVPGWILSRGRRRVVRPLPATRELMVARNIHAANRRMRHVRLGAADRKLLAKSLDAASEQADANVRAALRPRIRGVLDKVELRAKSDPERLARHKLIEELLDHVVDTGYLSFGALRDAISRNQLKLDDLAGGGELLSGDALLKADALLADELDGIYRRGDIYLRGLQKVSSVPFGTRIGRVLTLYVILPLGASYVVLEGVHHVLSPPVMWLGGPELHTLTPTSFVVTAALFFALIHSGPFRAFARQALEIVGMVLATIFFRLPRAVLRAPAVRRLLARPGVRVALRRVLVPAAVAGLVYWLAPFRTRDLWLGVAGALATFLLTSGVMGSPLGAWFEDFVVDQLAPTWKVLSRQWLPGLLRLVSRFFAALMDLLQRAIYRVDELLRFHEGQSRAMVLLKGAVGLAWAMVAYVVRLYMTLLVEPEINPLKHFPVVTVAHKLMVPLTIDLLVLLDAPLKQGGPVLAAFAGVTVFLLPSVFGFLAWELKENYKLYRATRAEGLGEARVGPHGETIRGLLVVGLHSGTLPKLYERLRRAAQREDENAAGGALFGGSSGRRNDAGLGRFREGIRMLAIDVRRFVDRELAALLGRSRRWRHGAIEVRRVDLSSNRVRVQLACPVLSDAVCELTFEEQSGHIVAGIPQDGFVAELVDRDAEGALMFENALAGLYQRAEVDLVREQIEAALGEGVHYDVADEGLVVWPGRDFRTELVYRLDRRGKRALPPAVRGAAPEQPPPVLDTRHILFPTQGITWTAWVAAWTAADHDSAPIPRLMQGASILPGLGGEVGMPSRVPPASPQAEPEESWPGPAELPQIELRAGSGHTVVMVDEARGPGDTVVIDADGD